MGRASLYCATHIEKFIALEELLVTGLFPESRCNFYVSTYTTLSSFTVMTCYAIRINNNYYYVHIAIVH